MMLVSIILFIVSVDQVYPIEVHASDPLGLMSKMPPAYWAGLSVLVLACVMSFLDRDLKSDAIFMALLLTLGLFLVGIVVFGCANAQNPNDYLFLAQAKTVMTEHHVEDPQPGSLVDYASWPAYHFLSASLIRVAGLAPAFVLKYWSLFGVAAVSFITYSIGKRFRLASGSCFLVSFLVISSWLASFFGWSPRSLGMILLLLLLWLLLTWQRTPSDTAVICLVFTSLVITHGLAAIAVFPVLILVSLYRRDGSLIVPFAAVFGAWYLYEAYAAMQAGIKQFLLYPLLSVFRYSEASRYEMSSAVARAVARYTQLGRVAAYVPFVIGSALLVWKRRGVGYEMRRVTTAFCWLIGAIPIVLVSYGEELQRAYLFAVAPSAVILALCITNRRVLVPLMCISVALFLPANHAATVSWGQVLTTELRGSEFAAQRLNASFPATIFYPDSGIIQYFNPNANVSLYSTTYRVPSPSDADISELDTLDFVIVSKAQNQSLLFSWGEDPYSGWPQTTAGQKADLIYDNGDFELYMNHLG